MYIYKIKYIYIYIIYIIIYICMMYMKLAGGLSGKNLKAACRF